MPQISLTITLMPNGQTRTQFDTPDGQGPSGRQYARMMAAGIAAILSGAAEVDRLAGTGDAVVTTILKELNLLAPPLQICGQLAVRTKEPDR